MSGMMKPVLATVIAWSVASPVLAENWAVFSSSQTLHYLADVDTLAPVEGVSTVRMARVPATGPASDLSHETEEVLIRCSDGQSKSGATATYGEDGVETDRYTDETSWEQTPAGGVYGSLKSFACDDMRPAGQSYPTIRAFIEGGRGQ